MRTVLIYTLVGAAAGLLVAQFLPTLGRTGLDKGLSDMAYGLGAAKPFAHNAAWGAGLGALLGLALKNKD